MGKFSKTAEKLGFDNALTDAAGRFEDIYKMGDQYGSEFWDAAGGDFSGFGNLATGAVTMYAINETFGKAFANNSPGAAVGSQLGQGAGMAAAGPFGAIAGGMMGAIAGDMVMGLTGNEDVDYDIRTSQGTGGFEDDQFITTPFGNIGFNASSTRNLSMNKMGNPMLAAYAKMLGPMDMQLASVLNSDEMKQVRGKLETNIDNSHIHGPEYTMKLMLRDRMKAIDSTMSDKRKAETGWGDLLKDYNAQYTAADRSGAERMVELQSIIDTFDDQGLMTPAFQRSRFSSAKYELQALMEQQPELQQLVDRADGIQAQGNPWSVKPTDLRSTIARHYDSIDESNNRLRV